jgi:RIO-like serine/threonine protein kinase
MENLSGNPYSKVWKDGDWVYKQQHEFLTRNEIWFYNQMYPSGYVPFAEQVEKDTIRLGYVLTRAFITSKDALWSHYQPILDALSSAGIRHGDLTKYAVLIDVHTEHPYLIDFAESRLMGDPRPEKRPEGDAYWLYRTFKELTGRDG